MAAQSPGRARACFDLKRTTFPLISLVLRTADLAAVERELQARFGESPDFFDEDLLVLNLAQLRADDPAIDFSALIELLRSWRVQPIGVHGGSPTQMAAAARAGLVATPDVSAAASMARSARSESNEDDSGSGPAGNAAAVPASRTAPPAAVNAAPSAYVASAAAAASANAAASAEAAQQSGADLPPPAAVLPASTLVIDKPLRSGQRVYARGADLVLLDVVSHGAEVIADGNVHVYAPLRGRAIAGARGDESARIFTTCLDPQLIAIAGVYRTAETPFPPEVAGRPAQVRRVADSLLIEPLEFPALFTKDKL
jgi:septum site-determining protein MinC